MKCATLTEMCVRRGVLSSSLDLWDSSFWLWEPLLPLALHLHRFPFRHLHGALPRVQCQSTPIGARSVFRVFVGLTSALLCHTRFLAAENCPLFWFLWTSLLCSKRHRRCCLRCKLESAVFFRTNSPTFRNASSQPILLCTGLMKPPSDQIEFFLSSVAR